MRPNKRMQPTGTSRRRPIGHNVLVEHKGTLICVGASYYPQLMRGPLDSPTSTKGGRCGFSLTERQLWFSLILSLYLVCFARTVALMESTQVGRRS